MWHYYSDRIIYAYKQFKFEIYRTRKISEHSFRQYQCSFSLWIILWENQINFCWDFTRHVHAKCSQMCNRRSSDKILKWWTFLGLHFWKSIGSSAKPSHNCCRDSEISRCGEGEIQNFKSVPVHVYYQSKIQTTILY